MQHGRHPPLGIIMLDIAIERPPGDVGHSASWPFDVVFRTVPGATARKIVNGDDADLMDDSSPPAMSCVPRARSA